MTDQQLYKALESAIDASCIEYVIDALAEICIAKAGNAAKLTGGALDAEHFEKCGKALKDLERELLA